MKIKIDINLILNQTIAILISSLIIGLVLFFIGVGKEVKKEVGQADQLMGIINNSNQLINRAMDVLNEEIR